jgi:hypothetical protein
MHIYFLSDLSDYPIGRVQAHVFIVIFRVRMCRPFIFV